MPKNVKRPSVARTESKRRSASAGKINTHKPRLESLTSASADRVPAAIAGLFEESNDTITSASSESLSSSLSSSNTNISVSTLSGFTMRATPNLVHNEFIIPLEEFPNKTQCPYCGQPVVPEYTSTPSCLSSLLMTFCCPCVFCNCCNLQEKYERLKKPVFICPECQVIMSDVPEDFDPYSHHSQQSHRRKRRTSRKRHRSVDPDRRSETSIRSGDSRHSR